MAITNQERVGKAMELLRAGLAPFVEREFENLHHGAGGRDGASPSRRRPAGRAASRSSGLGRRGTPSSSCGTPGTTCSRKTLGRAERSLVQELRDCPQQVGAPGAVLERRRRPGARLDGAPAHRRLGARRPTKSAR